MKAPERLQPILKAVRQRAAERRALRPLASLRQELQVDSTRRQRFIDALSGPQLAIIAECKRRAPSSGELSTEGSLEDRIRGYEQGGANLLSILTETDFFGGKLDDLQAAPEVQLPRIRKDFILDEAMLVEAQLAGAHAVLLIAACLDPRQLAELRAQAAELGLAVLLEVHNETELQIALPLRPDALGVNSRDLTSFEIDLATCEQLLPMVPDDCLRVAESGLYELKDLQRMQTVGADAVLIGTALMKSPNPTGLLREWRTALDA